MGKEKEIKAYKATSKRLRMHSLSEAEMRDLIAHELDSDKLAWYQDRLDKALNDRKRCVYYLPWKIEDKKTKEHIGWFNYDGPLNDYTMTVNVAIEEDKRRNGYAFEAIKAMAQYAGTANTKCYLIDATVDDDNEAATALVNKIKFIPIGSQDGRTHYGLFRKFVSQATTYMSIGMIFGVAYGTSSSNGMGIILGMAIGYLVGLSIDKKNRELYLNTVNELRARYNLAPLTEEDVKKGKNVSKNASQATTSEESNETESENDEF